MLIKRNIKKGREVYKINNGYLKRYACNGRYGLSWLENHIQDLNIVNPGYVLDYGSEKDHVWIKVKALPGKPAGEFERTDEFIKSVIEFCKRNYKETYPYAHFDWAISNILIDNNQMYLCDWDNLSKYYSEQEVQDKMYNNLYKPFGEKINAYI